MKVVVYFATGYEEVEALAVVDILRRGNVEVIMAGVTSEQVASSRGITVMMDKLAEQIVYEEVDMIVLPGGLQGVEGLKASPIVTNQLKAFKEQGKWIGAICAAPSILGELGFLKGEKATCYPSFEKSIDGGEYVIEPVVVSGNLITSRGAGTSWHFALALLEVLAGKEKRNEVAKAILFE